MISVAKTLLFLLLSTALVTETQTQCTSFPSNLDFMVTGTMQLGQPSTSFANQDYSVTFPSSSNLGLYANIFSAFAITGLETPSGQNFYSVVVDRVFLTNSNSAMRIIMDYTNEDGNIQTQWTKVELSYILVSPEFQGISTGGHAGNSYVWASSVELEPPANNEPIDSNTLFSHSNAANVCGYVDSFPAQFGTNCPADAQILYHYYVMGFRYDSSSDSTYEFRVSVLGGDGSSNDETDFDITIGTGVTPNGPEMTIDDYNDRLDSIKVGIVITVIRDFATYPTQASNPQDFEYSAIFMPLSTFNSVVSVSSSSTRNINYFDIGFSNYKIFGFSSLELRANNFEVDLSLDVRDLYSLILETSNTLSEVIVSSDIFTKDVNVDCVSSLEEQISIEREEYSSFPFLTTNEQSLIKLPSSNGILTDASSEFVFEITAFDIGSDSSVITYEMEITYNDLTPGKAYQIQTAFDEQGATDLPNGLEVRYSVSVDGVSVFLDEITMTSSSDDVVNNLGRTINSTSVVITIMVAFDRSATTDLDFRINLALYEIESVFDPVSQCCAASCPAGTGINLNTQPVTCVTCDSSSGSFYNSDTNQCECISGFYLVSTVSQTCQQCSANLCSVCNASSPTRCQTCIVGAELDPFTLICECEDGLIEQNGQCTACDYKCANCQSTIACTACSDANRNISNGCNCVEGYYDNGTPTCQLCSDNCLGCFGTSTNCTSCESGQNKAFLNNQCVCNTGFYPVVNASGFSECLACNPICDSCTGSAFSCDLCNPNDNKVPGFDSLNRRTCLCASGYFLHANGSCLQTDCSSDPFCEQCSTNGVSICLECKAGLNRVLNTNSYVCECAVGFYENSTLNQCMSCPDACATCTSSTACQSCVPGAFQSANTCACLSGLFFTTTPIRFCQSCTEHCETCLSTGVCIQCESGYQLKSSNECVCASGNFIDVQTGECVGCPSECATCDSLGNCLTCANNRPLENGQCVSRCSLGFFRQNDTCVSCGSGCSFCQNASTCLVCNNGLYPYQGLCYANCPSGTVLDQSTQSCQACNSPCRTCTVHPSRCTSCEVNNGSLYEGNCVVSCPAGTFALNGVCEFCDFSCATCLGDSRRCIGCPVGRFLYQGQCLAFCPDPNGCQEECPAGFYLSPSTNRCISCPSECQECNALGECTVCASSRFRYNNTCLNSCPSNTYASNGFCVGCNAACATCRGSTASDCNTCSSGFVFQNGVCVQSNNPINCPVGQYFSAAANSCRFCNSSCLACSSFNFCTQCPFNSIPVNGQCSNINQNLCPSNCFSCPQNNSVCQLCDIGFSLYEGRCVSSCPFPLNSVNGVCQCSTGQFLFQGQCLSSCPSGYLRTGNSCVSCDSNCRECNGSTTFCTSCNEGFVLDTARRACRQVNTNVSCPIGQFEENGQCVRFCPVGTVYQNGLCYASCFTGLVPNNFGGCIEDESQCPSGQFSLNGDCFSQCPLGYYGNSTTFECTLCPNNCDVCSSLSFCSQCSSGYRLSNGLCLEIIVNPPQTGCGEGRYFNETQGLCAACVSPCANCFDSARCQTCIQGYNLVLGQCIRNFINCNSTQYLNPTTGQCANCISPCSSCTGASQCTSCVQGYQLDSTQSGQCTFVNNQNLVELSGLRVESSYLRGNTVIASIILPVVPNPLTYNQENNFFNVRQSNLVNTIVSVNQWQDILNRNRMWIAVNFQAVSGSMFLFFSVNNSSLGAAYAQLGYRINEQAYKAVSVYTTLQQPPNTIQIPDDSLTVPYVYNS